MKKFLLAALLFAVASPAWSRAAPRNETRICEGTVELNQPGANPDWYRIADCHFDGTKEGKAITSDYFGVDRLLIKIRFGIPDRSTTVSVCGKGSVADLALCRNSPIRPRRGLLADGAKLVTLGLFLGHGFLLWT
jgi:hypothetical protein